MKEILWSKSSNAWAKAHFKVKSRSIQGHLNVGQGQVKVKSSSNRIKIKKRPQI